MSENDLTQFIDSVCGESHLRVETDFGDGFVRLRSSEAERRQAAQDIRSSEDVIIELLRNSRDARAQHIYLAVSREASHRRITIIDDGEGIPASMHERIFEPRVTSKLDTAHQDKWGMHGRGMAMYSISVNSLESRVVCSDVSMGTAIVVVCDIEKLGEKTDQSSFPVFIVDDNGTFVMRGPKNILRTACEFALEHRTDCRVYCGTPAEIAALLYARGSSTLSLSEAAFCSDERVLPLCDRLAVAADPAHFSRIASDLGLNLSERTARRIIDGEEPLICDLVTRMSSESFSKAGCDKPVSSSASDSQNFTENRPLKLTVNDKELLLRALDSVVGDISDRYYIEVGNARLRVSGDAIHITLPYEKLR